MAGMKDKTKEAAVIADIGKMAISAIRAKHKVGKNTVNGLIIDMGDTYKPFVPEGCVRLSTDDVRLIVALNKAYPEIPPHEIAKKFEAKTARVNDILSGRKWSSVTGIRSA